MVHGPIMNDETIVNGGTQLDEGPRRRNGTSNDYRVANGSTPKSPRKMEEASAGDLRERMQEMKQDVVEHVNDRIDHMVTEILQNLESTKGRKTKDLFPDTRKYSNERKLSRSGLLPNKEFVERNSVLTDLFEVTHIHTIYNIFMVILLFLLMNTAIHDIMDTGTMNVGVSTIMKGFGKFTTGLQIWCFMKASALMSYVFFNVWASKRQELLPKSFKLKLWDYGWLAILISYEILHMVLPARETVKHDLPIATGAALLMEQVRILMKVHAFVRSTAPRFLSYKPHTEMAKPKGPGFSHFLYFMFAPTLVYRDSYPRTKEIRWKVVIWNYLEVVMVIFCLAFITERFIMPVHREFGTQPLKFRTIVINILDTMTPSMLFFLCGFYCLLHSWMNASAELLRFADRLFYEDWWNSKSYRRYYRTWNIVVHDWLYTYIYKDMYEIVTPGNKVLSTCMVFTVSAIFHEYILAFAMGFFYPMLLLMFSFFGLLLMLIFNVNSNVFIWFSLYAGTGILLGLYFMEYYARVNCPAYYDGMLDLFLPRSWYCYMHNGA